MVGHGSYLFVIKIKILRRNLVNFCYGLFENEILRKFKIANFFLFSKKILVRTHKNCLKQFDLELLVLISAIAVKCFLNSRSET